MANENQVDENQYAIEKHNKTIENYFELRRKQLREQIQDDLDRRYLPKWKYILIKIFGRNK